jgi:hypothetical protein
MFINAAHQAKTRRCWRPHGCASRRQARDVLAENIANVDTPISAEDLAAAVSEGG